MWEWEENEKNVDEDVIEQISRYLKNRDYFEAELITKLRQKEYGSEKIERGLAYFRELGLLNDGELAYKYALQRLEKEGPNKVLARLIAKSVAGEVAKEALKKALEDSISSLQDGLSFHLENELSKMGKTLEDLDYRERQNLARRLYNKGYDSGQIMSLLNV